MKPFTYRKRNIEAFKALIEKYKVFNEDDFNRILKELSEIGMRHSFQYIMEKYSGFGNKLKCTLCISAYELLLEYIKDNPKQAKTLTENSFMLRCYFCVHNIQLPAVCNHQGSYCNIYNGRGDTFEELRELLDERIESMEKLLEIAEEQKINHENNLCKLTQKEEQ